MTEIERVWDTQWVEYGNIWKHKENQENADQQETSFKWAGTCALRATSQQANGEPNQEHDAHSRSRMSSGMSQDVPNRIPTNPCAVALFSQKLAKICRITTTSCHVSRIQGCLFMFVLCLHFTWFYIFTYIYNMLAWFSLILFYETCLILS